MTVYNCRGRSILVPVITLRFEVLDKLHDRGALDLISAHVIGLEQVTLGWLQALSWEGTVVGLIELSR